MKIYHLLPLLLLVMACGGGQKQREVKEMVSQEPDPMPQASVAETTNSVVGDTAEIKMLKEFYSAELAPRLRKRDELQKHYDNYFSKAMRGRIWRMLWDADASMVIRAQDVPVDSCETLKIDPLGNSWYRVSYTSGRGTDYEKSISIPVKVVKEDGKYCVGYITPEALGGQYGDSLWYSGTEFPEVDRTEPLAFVKSFYDLYTLKHSTLSEHLLQELAAIRSDYLTPKALSCFNRMEQLSSNDGYPEYDVLIGRHDFEYPWRSSVSVNPTDQPDVFQVSVLDDSIRINVTEQEGKYYIDDIYNKECESFLPVE